MRSALPYIGLELAEYLACVRHTLDRQDFRALAAADHRWDIRKALILSEWKEQVFDRRSRGGRDGSGSGQ